MNALCLRRAGRLALAVPLLVGLGSPGIATTAALPSPPPGHHLSVDSTVYPWSSLAKLFNSVGGSCTGVVIGPSQVLTAGHCVYAFRTRAFLPPAALHVLLGYARGAYVTHARVLRYRLGPGYDPNAEQRTLGSDWVVLDLAEPLPAAVRPLRLGPVPEPRDGAIMLAGFARDRAFVMTADNDCRITGRIDPGRLIAHDCVIQPGDSGAPLLRRAPDGAEVTVVGVAVGLSKAGGKDLGIAAPLPPDLATAATR